MFEVTTKWFFLHKKRETGESKKCKAQKEVDHFDNTLIDLFSVNKNGLVKHKNIDKTKKPTTVYFEI